MEEKEAFQKIMTIIKPYVKNEEAFKNANASTRFIEDLKINSARLVDIVLEIEDQFHFPISDEEAGNIQTIGTAMEMIQQKLHTHKV